MIPREKDNIVHIDSDSAPRIIHSGEDFLYEKRMQGSSMGSNRFRIDLPRYVDMYLDGRLFLDEMVSDRIALDEVNAGFAEMRTGRVARNVIVME